MSIATQTQTRALPYEEIDGVRYPWYEEDDSMVQSDRHGLTIAEAINMVSAVLRDRPTARVFTDVFLFWEKGSPQKRHAPDLFVLPEVDRPERERKSVKLWLERSRPVFVLEVLSERSAHHDFGEKYDAYEAEIGIPEYFIVDPTPRPVYVRGYRLEEGGYLPIASDEEGRVWSETLGAWWGASEGGTLQLWDAQGRPVPRYGEAVDRIAAAERRAEDETRRRVEMEARVRELEEALRQQKEQG